MGFPFSAQLGAKTSETQTRKMVDKVGCFLPWLPQAFDRRHAVFAVTVLFDIHPGQMEAFLPRMIENARTSRNTEPGCQQFDVCQEGDQVFLYEIYDDRAAFDAHLGSAHFKSFDAGVAKMVAGKDVQIYERVLR